MFSKNLNERFMNVLGLFESTLKEPMEKGGAFQKNCLLHSKWANQIPSTCDGNGSRPVMCVPALWRWWAEFK